MLVGREAECAHLDRLVTGARQGRSAVLVVRGGAGIGKSALLRYAGERAAAIPVRATRGIESEVEVAFSSLRDLVQPDLDRMGELPAAQAAALSGALSLGPPVPDSRYAVAAATLTLLSAVAEQAGLVVAVDDAQWLDPPTAQVLGFAARRLEAEGVVVLFAVRDGEPSALDDSDLPELRLRGLDRDAADALLARHGEVAPDVAERLFRATGGNPLALRELPSMLTAAALAGRESLDEPLRVGRRVEEVFAQRMASLAAPTRWCLLLAAASETPSLVTVSAAAAEAGFDLEVLEPAEHAGLVALDERRVEFAHPLLRSVIYQRAPASERRRAHRVLAAVAAPGQVDRRAWHLSRAAAGPEEAIAAGLEEAAVAARTRAGAGAGAAAFERAAQLTPDPRERSRRLIEAARDYQLVGHCEASSALADQALATTDDAAVHADAALLHARIQVWQGEPARAFAALRAQASAVEDADPVRASALLTDAAVIATMRGDYPAQVATATAARSAAQRAGGDPAAAAADLVLAHGLVNTGRGAEGEQLLRRHEADIDGGALAGASLLQLAGFAWMCLEDHPRARRFLDGAVGSLRDAGAFGALPFLLACRSMLDYRTGRWASAAAAAWEAVRLAEEVDHDSELAFYLVCLATLEAAQGRDSDCRAHLEQASDLVERFGVDSVLPWMEAALGALELGRGRFDEAIVALERIPVLVERMGIREPTLVQWLPDLVEAYARVGQLDHASRALDDLESQAEATGRVWALAAAARCRGLLSCDDDIDGHFQTALAYHERVPAPFELARTQRCFGEKLGLARRRTEARRPLGSALATFERLGAAPWADGARAELARNGGRAGPRTDTALDRLTPRELQVALAVADGTANKQAAAALFLSTKTIEFHLGNTYRKLGVRSRTELARLLTE